MPTDARGPDLDALRRLLAARDQQRAAGAASEPEAAERVARALLDQPPPGLDCETVQDALPGRVADVLRGAPRPTPDPIGEHLNACAECSALYAEMLARAQGPAPAVEELPELDLAALRRARQFAARRTFVTETARALIARLRPDALPNLALLLEPFFERVRDLPAGARFGPAFAGALGYGGRRPPPLSPAVQYLAATFIATSELGRAAPPERVAALTAEGRYEAIIRQVAHRAAQDVRLAGPDAQRFAEEFTHLVMAAPGEQPPAFGA